jgi:hypothetical protein
MAASLIASGASPSACTAVQTSVAGSLAAHHAEHPLEVEALARAQ